MNVDTYLEFLRFALNDDSAVPNSVANINWQGLLRFAKEQAIVGIYARRILFTNNKLNDCNWLGNKPNEDDVMEWMGEVAKLRKRNTLLFEKTADIARRFHGDGFDCCILKGQGNALRYPIPVLRTSGDIDIWLGNNENTVKTLRKEILQYVRKDYPKAEMVYQHIEYPIYNNVPVEIHFHATYLNNPIHNKKLQSYLSKQFSLLSKHIVSYKDEESRYSFPAPTDSFNRFFEMCHIMHHYFDEGIGLRQLIDYYYLLSKGFTQEEKESDCSLLIKYGMYRFAAAVMYIMENALGLSEQYLLMPPDCNAGRRLLADIINGGNFGKYNKAFEHNNNHINPSRFFYKSFHNLSLAKYYPSEVLWEPLFRMWHFLWRRSQ